ncbi:MAG TPA: EpsI family protein [Planctomycetota bacterium]|jgi:EpsI family protein|nr:EpsI family protein [Planctomycetota bacterium]
MKRLPGLLCAALLAAAYASTLHWLGDRWLAAGSPYAHGPVVAAVAGFFAVRRLRGLASDGRTRAGLPLLAAGFSLHLAGLLARIDSVSGFSLLLLLPGLAGALRGRRALRESLAPVLFLAFAIPIPIKFVADLSFHLKEGSASAAVAATNLLGLGVERTGPSLRLRDGPTLVVGEACSGLRSLLGFGTLAYAYGFLFTRRRPGAASALLLLAAPLAFLANTVRLGLLIVAARFFGAESLRGIAHEAAALPLYLGAFGLLVLLDRKVLPGTAPPPPSPPAAGGLPPSAGRARALVAAGSILSIALQLSRAGPPPAPAPLAAVVPRELAGSVARDLPVTERMIALLETRDVVYRVYEKEGEPAVTVALIRGAGQRKAAHPPEVCYLGSGFDLLDRGTLRVGATPPLEARTLSASGPGGRLLCAYFYLSGGRATSSYLRHQWDFLLDAFSGGGGRSLLVRLDTFLGRGETEDAARDRLQALATALLPFLLPSP